MWRAARCCPGESKMEFEHVPHKSCKLQHVVIGTQSNALVQGVSKRELTTSPGPSLDSSSHVRLDHWTVVLVATELDRVIHSARHEPRLLGFLRKIQCDCGAGSSTSPFLVEDGLMRGAELLIDWPPFWFL